MALLKNVLGLDLGTHSVKAIEIRQSLRNFEIVTSCSFPLPDPDTSVAELARSLVVENRLSTEHVVAALRGEFESDARRFHFVGHQANLRMLESVCRRCNIPADRHHTNVEWFGNTGCASSASVISMNWEKWIDRDDLAVVGVGAGLTWSSYLLRFGSDA